MTDPATLIISALSVFFCLLSVVLFLRLQALKKTPGNPVAPLPEATNPNDSSLLETLPIPIYRKDTEGRLLYINKAFEELMGRSRETLIGKSVDDFNPPELASIYKSQDKKLLERGGDQIYESKIETRQGETRNIVFHKRALCDSNGQVSELIGLAFDITERKQIEQQLLEQQKMFISLVENLPDVILRYDRDFHRTYMNPAYFELTGNPASQVIGSNAGEFWKGDIPFEEYKGLIRKVFETGRVQKRVVSQPDRQGKSHLFSISLVPETTSTGEVTGVFAIGHDITQLKQTENQFSNLTHNWPDEIASYDTDCRRTFINPTMEQTLQKRCGGKAQLLGRTPTETFPGIAEIANYENKLKEVLATGKICDVDMTWALGTEKQRYRQVKMLPEFDTAGKIRGVFTVARDITKQKQAEIEKQKNLDFFANLDRINRAMQQSNDLNQVMNDTLKVILEIFDTDRAFLTYPLDPAADYFHAPIEQTRPEYPGAFELNQKVRIDDGYRRMIQIELASDTPVRFGPGGEHPLPPALTETFQVESMLAMALYPKVGQPWNFGLHHCSAARTWTEDEVRLFSEISKRLCDALTATLSYQDLEEGKQFIDNIFEHMPTMVYVKDAETLKFLKVNKSAEEFMGVPEAELIGKTSHDFFPEEEADEYRRKDLEALQSREGATYEKEAQTSPEGRKYYLQKKRVRLTDQHGKPTFLLLVIEDITQLRLSQEATRRFTQVITQSPYAIVFTDGDGNIEFANHKFYELEKLREEDLAQLTIKQLFDLDKDELQQVAQVIKENGIWRLEQQQKLDSGESCWKHIQITAITDNELPDKPISNFIIMSEDISERKLLEEQFNHSQKMEAIGQLAGGVAHDFNNMLGVIVGRTDLALTRLNSDDPLYESLQEISKAATRSADLTRQLLAFARKQDRAPKILDLNETVEATLNMLRRLIGEDIHLAWLPSPKVWPIKMDPSQLDQILTNLCVNARDAIRDGGKITIETANVTLDETYCHYHSEAIPGSFVTLSISDNGCGIDRQLIGKIFDPFFTTKDQEKGTGLGLSTVYGIVKQNNGFINVYSEPEKGSTFTLYLPRTESSASDNQQTGTGALPRGHETILVVEDDQTILATEKSMLEMLGYRVFAAETAAEAILLAEQYSGHIQLLISDVVMPDMNGRELVQLMTTHYPELKTLYMSGYTGDVIAHHGILEEGVNFIQKPFSLHSLAGKVREVLDH